MGRGFRRLGGSVPVVLTGVIGLLLGIGVMFLVFRPDDGGASYFDGPASVGEIDRPAGSATASPTGEEILSSAAAVTAPAGPAVEPASARSALQAFLDAEIDDRAADSFALLHPDTQQRYATVAAWRQSRSDRVIPQQFSIVAERQVAGGLVDLTVRANRAPSITPFRGFVPAESTERWRVERSAAGWRVRGGVPQSVEPDLPTDGLAVTAAQRWVDAASRCDPAAVALQVERVLVGASEIANDICKAKAEWTTSRIRPLAEVSDVTAFVAAFGPSVGRWARGVEVTSPGAGGTDRFTVVLGPVGPEWRVIGLTTATSGSG